MTGTDKILSAIDDLKRDTDARFDQLDKRLDRMDGTDAATQGQVQSLATRVGVLESRMASADDRQTSERKSRDDADRALEAALKGAMSIQSRAVADLKTTTESRLTNQDTELVAIKKEVSATRSGIDGLVTRLTDWQGRPWFKWLMLLGTIAGAAIGAAAAAYLTHTGH